MEEKTVTFETYIPYGYNGKDNYDDLNDDALLYFTVPYNWYLEYLNKYYDIADLNEFHTPEEGEDLDTAFREEYTWEDTFFMYDTAGSDRVLINEEIR